MTKLFCKLLEDSLSEYAYAADLAGLSYMVTNTIPGMYVCLYVFVLCLCAVRVCVLLCACLCA